MNGRPSATAAVVPIETLEARKLLSDTPAGGVFHVEGRMPQLGNTSQVTVEADGSFVHTWVNYPDQDGKPTVLTAQRYGSDGRPLGSSMVLDQFDPSPDFWSYDVAADAAGDIVAVWMVADPQQAAEGDTATDVYVRRYSPRGEPLGPASRVNTSTDGIQDQMQVVVRPEGDFAVTWRSSVDPAKADYHNQLFARRYDADGEPLGDEFRVDNSADDSARWDARPALTADGGLIVAWNAEPFPTNDVPSPDGPDIYARRFSPTGQPLGDEFLVTAKQGWQSSPVIAVQRGGGFVVAWKDDPEAGSGEYVDIRARLYDADGHSTGDPFRVNQSPELVFNARTPIALAPGATGGFVVFWEAPGIGPTYLLARPFDATGTPMSGDLKLTASFSTIVGGLEGGERGRFFALSSHSEVAHSDLNFQWYTLSTGSDPRPASAPQPQPEPEPQPGVNHAPTTSGIADAAVDAGTTETTVNLFDAFADAEDPDSALTFRITRATNTVLYSEIPIDPATGTLTFHYAIGQIGSTTLTVQATDTGGLTVETNFTLTVRPPPSAPTEPPKTPAVATGGGSVVGQLFSDDDGNGKRAKRETGLAGVKVFIDADGDAVADPEEPVTTTADDGSFALANLGAGVYVVRVEAPEGMALSKGGSDVVQAVVRSGVGRRATARLKPLGLRGSGLIGGSVFLDADGDRNRNESESGLSRQRVFLDVNGDGVWQKKTERAVVTDRLGNWSFAGLEPGAYRVGLVVRRGFRVTTPTGGTVSVDVTADGAPSEDNVFSVAKTS